MKGRQPGVFTAPYIRTETRADGRKITTIALTCGNCKKPRPTQALSMVLRLVHRGEWSNFCRACTIPKTYKKSDDG